LVEIPWPAGNGAQWDVIPKLGAVQPSEESGAECFNSSGSLTLHARSLAPLVKALGLRDDFFMIGPTFPGLEKRETWGTRQGWTTMKAAVTVNQNP